jgi:hypothetical protein
MRTLRWSMILLAAACGAAPSAPEAQEPLTIVRLRREPVSFTYVSGFDEPRHFVVRDANAWQQTWTELWRNHVPLPPLPAINFEREMVVVAALGTRPSGGFSVFIDSASAGPDGVVVRVRALSPGSDCAVTLAVTQPVDVARVPRRDGSVAFTERHEIQNCR